MFLNLIFYFLSMKNLDKIKQDAERFRKDIFRIVKEEEVNLKERGINYLIAQCFRENGYDAEAITGSFTKRDFVKKVKIPFIWTKVIKGLSEIIVAYYNQIYVEDMEISNTLVVRKVKIFEREYSDIKMDNEDYIMKPEIVKILRKIVDKK